MANGQNNPMDALKFIEMALVQLARQIWSLPQTIAHAAKRRRRRIAFNEFETERLDRIRNPSKYLGK